MEIRSPLNVRGVLWCKSVSLLLLKRHNCSCSSAAGREKKPERAFKKAPFLLSVEVSWAFSFLVLLSPAFPSILFGRTFL